MSTENNYLKQLDAIQFDDIYDIHNFKTALEIKLRRISNQKTNLLSNMGLREVQDPNDIIDVMAGALSGDYQADLKNAMEVSNCWFCYNDYQQAYQISQQP